MIDGAPDAVLKVGSAKGEDLVRADGDARQAARLLVRISGVPRVMTIVCS
jgi:hypothetical protein